MGSWCQKSLLKSLFYFNFLSSIYYKKLQNHTSLSSFPYQRFSGLIRFSLACEAPHFCTNCKHCGRLIHDRKMQNILCARFRSTVSPSNEARNAITQRRNEMHSMAAVNEQKFHAMLSRERLIAFLINLSIILYLLLYTPSNQHFKAFLVSKFN